jgi:hypothetical protein
VLGELRTYHLRDVLHAVQVLPRTRVLLAFSLTALSCSAATGGSVCLQRYRNFKMCPAKRSVHEDVSKRNPHERLEKG